MYTVHQRTQVDGLTAANILLREFLATAIYCTLRIPEDRQVGRYACLYQVFYSIEQLRTRYTAVAVRKSYFLFRRRGGSAIYKNNPIILVLLFLYRSHSGL